MPEFATWVTRNFLILVSKFIMSIVENINEEYIYIFLYIYSFIYCQSIKRHIEIEIYNHPTVQIDYSHENDINLDDRSAWSRQSLCCCIPTIYIFSFSIIFAYLSLPSISHYSFKQHEKGVVHGRVGIVKTSGSASRTSNDIHRHIIVDRETLRTQTSKATERNGKASKSEA